MRNLPITMCTLLALDTASDYCSVALLKQGQVEQIRQQAPRQHTQLLLPQVDQLLQQQGVALQDIDAIAFGAGPGSFTGLRICFAVVQGLAYGAQLPVLPVSTLAAMALAQQRAVDAPEGSVFFPALDARMSEVYWGAYVQKNGQLQTLQVDALSAPEDAAAAIQALADSAAGRCYHIGPGWHYPSLAAMTAAADLTIEPAAADIVRLGQLQFAAGLSQDIKALQPLYLRNEISWEKRQRIRPQTDTQP
ncbi:MAG: tRNA (adenosine(37)-N6)-threonylcarbamoyltransferase complex dimerization subunit type 1 TsaB [Cellvibrionaceae bacterium]|nr:tRNA (adenosine(37)-N6)-threonylcarbamoyltransferase complex dimerization subunit type 1 TsaB [Cellvibrionaceae bacterium]